MCGVGMWGCVYNDPMYEVEDAMKAIAIMKDLEEPLLLLERIIDPILVIERSIYAPHGKSCVVFKVNDVPSYFKWEPDLRQTLRQRGFELFRFGSAIESTTFGLGRILPAELPAIGYHATRASVVPLILKVGLLPSNETRRLTSFPDTAGRIHIAPRLRKSEGASSAEEWAEMIASNAKITEPMALLRIDLSRFTPPSAFIHEDYHSSHGLVIEDVDSIPSHLISVVE